VIKTNRAGLIASIHTQLRARTRLTPQSPDACTQAREFRVKIGYAFRQRSDRSHATTLFGGQPIVALLL